MTDKEVVECILNADTEKLTIDQYSALHKYAPTSDETETLKSYTGPHEELANGKSTKVKLGQRKSNFEKIVLLLSQHFTSIIFVLRNIFLL